MTRARQKIRTRQVEGIQVMRELIGCQMESVHESKANLVTEQRKLENILDNQPELWHDRDGTASGPHVGGEIS